MAITFEKIIDDILDFDINTTNSSESQIDIFQKLLDFEISTVDTQNPKNFIKQKSPSDYETLISNIDILKSTDKAQGDSILYKLDYILKLIVSCAPTMSPNEKDTETDMASHEYAKYTPKQFLEFQETISVSEKAFNKKLNVLGVKISKSDEKINSTKDSIITLTVTVLGIFSSLTFALSGSLSILNNTFNTGNISFLEMLFRYGLVSLFVTNILFLLLYCIARLNNKSIAMHCSKCQTRSTVCATCDPPSKENPRAYGKKKCHECVHKTPSCSECETKTLFNRMYVGEENKYWFSQTLCKMWHKFFYVSIINIMTIILLLVSIVGMCLGIGVKGSPSNTLPNANITANISTNVNTTPTPLPTASPTPPSTEAPMVTP